MGRQKPHSCEDCVTFHILWFDISCSLQEEGIQSKALPQHTGSHHMPWTPNILSSIAPGLRASTVQRAPLHLHCKSVPFQYVEAVNTAINMSILQLIFSLPPVHPTLLGQSRIHGCLLLKTRRLAGEAARSRSTPTAFRTEGKRKPLGSGWREN